MKVPAITVLSSCIAALALAGASGAQSHVLPAPGKPLRSVTVDLATGAVTRGAHVADRVGTTVRDFYNLEITSGFLGYDTGGGTCEWIEAGVKGFAGNASDLVTRVVFPYCTVVADPASGGPGASLMLGLYSGYQTGGPAPTTAIALFNLTGLPGHSKNTSISGGGGSMSCYFMQLVFPNCIAFADGPFGYSWGFTDLGTTGVLAGTFPYLSCVASCAGPVPDGQGMDNIIDRYSPPGTFSFQIASPSHGISFAIDEVADAEATATTWNSQGVNTDLLGCTAIAIGATWQLDITLGHAHGASGPTNVKVRSSCINGPNLVSPTGHAIEVLTTGALSLVLSDAHDGATTSYPPFSVPSDITLVGIAWAAQGTVLGGGRADLTSARCGVVGSIDLVADP